MLHFQISLKKNSTCIRLDREETKNPETEYLYLIRVRSRSAACRELSSAAQCRPQLPPVHLPRVLSRTLHRTAGDTAVKTASHKLLFLITSGYYGILKKMLAK